MALGAKDIRDKKRRFNAKKGKGSKGYLHDVKGHVSDIRTVQAGSNKTEVVREEKFELSVPAELKDRVKKLFVKRNWMSYEQELEAEEHLRSTVLVINFRNKVKGLKGPIVNNAKQRKLRGITYTHVAIQSLSEASRDRMRKRDNEIDFYYDERAFRITWYGPASGQKKGKEKTGDTVYDATDELSVLQWLYENELTGLYDLKFLLSYGLLPMRDEDRLHENSIVTKMKVAFGATYALHPDCTFHRARLARRFRLLHEYNEEKGVESYEKTFVGGRALHAIEIGDLEGQEMYYSKTLSMVYGLFNMNGERYITTADLESRNIHVEMLKTDENGIEQMNKYRNFMSNDLFEKISWAEFCILMQGIRTVN